MAEREPQSPETRITDASPSDAESDRLEMEKNAPSKQHDETQDSTRGREDVDDGNMSRNEDTMLSEITQRCRKDWERYLVVTAIPQFKSPDDNFVFDEEDDDTRHHSNSGPESSPDKATSHEPDYKATATEKPPVEPGDMPLRYFNGNRRH